MTAAACERCSTAIEDGDLRCAICALPVPHAEKPVEKPRAKVLRCTWCHAAIAFEPAAGAPRCGFCGSTMTIEEPLDPVEAAELYVPFTVERALAEATVRTWLGRRGWFAPKTLRVEATLESLVPLAWAGWIVDAEALVTWTADSDDGARRSAWAPHSGQVTMRFAAICVPASRGLDDDECRLLCPYYDLATAAPIASRDSLPASSAAEGRRGSINDEHLHVIERFDAQRSAARAFIQRAIEATARTRVEDHIPGRRFRNVHVACLVERQATRRVALPAWVMAYRYRGTPYRAIVHGQRPEIVFGSSPVDWRKVALLSLALSAIAALIVLLVLWLQK
jgi:hypothetical protein